MIDRLGAPVGVYVADAREQAEGAPELGVDAVVEQHELSVRRGEAQLPHRVELVELGALVEIAILHARVRECVNACVFVQDINICKRQK